MKEYHRVRIAQLALPPRQPPSQEPSAPLELWFHSVPRSPFPRELDHSLLTLFLLPYSPQGGAQISLAEVCRSGERSTRWYNLLSYKYLKKQNREPQLVGATGLTPGPESTDAVSALLEQTAVELERRQEGRSTTETLEDSWRYQEETSENEAAAEEEEEEEGEDEEAEEDAFTEKASPDVDEFPALKVGGLGRCLWPSGSALSC